MVLNCSNIKKFNGEVKCLEAHDEYYCFLRRLKKYKMGYDPFTTAFKTDLKYSGDVERWACREATILWFAYAMHGFFETLSDKKLVLIAMPTSKPRDSALFNDRIDESLRALQNLGEYDVRFCIDRTCEVEPVFHNNEGRNIDKILDTSCICDEESISSDSMVFLVDDVIVTGAQFKAYKTVVAQHYGIDTSRIQGLFLSKFTLASRK